MPQFPYAIPVLGSLGVLVLAYVVALIARKVIESREGSLKEQYRLYRLANTVITVVTAAAIIGFWSKIFQHKGQFWGLIGAGLAISLREPLLSIAGRIAIFAGHMYSGGDRIEINKLSGDVIDIGFFYTRMMEIAIGSAVISTVGEPSSSPTHKYLGPPCLITRARSATSGMR